MRIFPMTTFEKNENPSLKKVGEITGHFFVPAYQRGYRWGRHEVEALLDDIYVDGKRGENDNYCLQPVVVKKYVAKDPRKFDIGPAPADVVPLPDEVAREHFELIDGQQRLTTLYLLYHYLKEKVGLDIPLRFSLFYQTRPLSTDYLCSLNPSQKNDNIDFFHMHGAYQCIGDWFEAIARRTNVPRQFVGYKVFGYLNEQIRVIWYDAGEVDSTTLFTRLNVGRIALTNAELVKALLLARRSGNGLANEHRQIEIATQWDMIERELQNDEFWAFLTNKPGKVYPTRIEFLFDLMAKKVSGEKERFHTFIYFKKLLDGQRDQDAQKVWGPILERYHLFREWFEDRERFHKVGYLVAIGVGLDELLNALDEKLTKTGFLAFLNDRIRTSIDLDAVAARELSYDADYEECNRLLLLFNVESVRRLEHSSERYP